MTATFFGRLRWQTTQSKFFINPKENTKLQLSFYCYQGDTQISESCQCTEVDRTFGHTNAGTERLFCKDGWTSKFSLSSSSFRNEHFLLNSNRPISYSTPIYKRSDSEDLQNSRPVSLTSILSKLFEKCSRDSDKWILKLIWLDDSISVQLQVKSGNKRWSGLLQWIFPEKNR